MTVPPREYSLEKDSCSYGLSLSAFSCENIVVVKGGRLMRQIRELRRMAGWTQTKTANASGINRAKLSQAECREVQLSQHEEAAVRRVLIVAIRDQAVRIDGVLSGEVRHKTIGATA